MSSDMMQIEKDELLLIYNSEDLEHRKALGYAEAAYKHKLKSLDLNNDTPTRKQLAEIASALGVEVRSLFDQNSDLYADKVKRSEFDEDDMLTLIVENPSLLKAPIALYHNKAEFVGSGYEFVNSDLEVTRSEFDKSKLDNP